VSEVALRIRAAVRMEPADKLPVAKPLTAGWGPTISYGGKLFPGRVLACDKPIKPGEVGEALIGVIAMSRHDIDMQAGTVFELRDGLTNLIATATVISLTDES
jgi:hypothetical protein